MSKDEFLKIQTCVLKVNIHCDGCQQKVKKILQKIDGVFTTKIDSDTGKVTVSGNAHPDLLIKKLHKAGKHAELWGSQKPNNNQNHHNLNNQIKNMHLDGNKGGGNNKGQKGVGGGGNNQQHHPNLPKGEPQGLTQQQLQQIQQQMKGLQDMKLPQFNNLKMPAKDQHRSSGGKPGAMSFHNDDDWDDDEFDDDYDDDDEFDDDDDDFEDDITQPVNKMKPGPGFGPGPNLMMPGMMKVGNDGSGRGGGNNGKKGGGNGGGAIPVHGPGGNGGNGKKGSGGGGGGNNGGNHQNQGGGGKNGGGKNGEMTSDGKSGGMTNNKNGNHGGGAGPNGNGNSGGKKVGGGGNSGIGAPFMENGFPKMGGNNMKMPMGGQLGNMPIGQMGNFQAIQGLPAASMGGGGGGASNGYYQGSGPDVMPGNPFQQQQQQQQYLAAVMNQQRAMGNEMFQPMMYARPPAAVNYVPAPYPAQYPYPHPLQGGDPYSYHFSDENPSSCNVM